MYITVVEEYNPNHSQSDGFSPAWESPKKTVIAIVGSDPYMIDQKLSGTLREDVPYVLKNPTTVRTSSDKGDREGSRLDRGTVIMYDASTHEISIVGKDEIKLLTSL